VLLRERAFAQDPQRQIAAPRHAGRVRRQRDTGDLTTLDDPAALQQIRDALASAIAPTSKG
jgi:hypothetical protein